MLAVSDSTDANGLRKQALAEMRKLGHTFMGGIPQT